MPEFEFNKPFSCHVETIGSHWYFDAGTCMYLRFAKEGHCENPAWGNTPGPLQDNFWHEYSSMRVNVYDINSFCDAECCPHLQIVVDGIVVVNAPKAKVVSITNREGITV